MPSEISDFSPAGGLLAWPPSRVSSRIDALLQFAQMMNDIIDALVIQHNYGGFSDTFRPTVYRAPSFSPIIMLQVRDCGSLWFNRCRR